MAGLKKEHEHECVGLQPAISENSINTLGAKEDDGNLF